MSQKNRSGSGSQHFMSGAVTSSNIESLKSASSNNPYNYTLSQQERQLIMDRERNTVSQLAQDMILLASTTGLGVPNHSTGLSASNSVTRLLSENNKSILNSGGPQTNSNATTNYASNFSQSNLNSHSASNNNKASK
jgi:hypothetical protein